MFNLEDKFSKNSTFKMMTAPWVYTGIFSLIVMGLTWGCSDEKQSFKGQGRAKQTRAPVDKPSQNVLPEQKPAVQLIKMTGFDGHQDLGSFEYKTIDIVDFSFKVGKRRLNMGDKLKTYTPLELYFVLDSTGSMSSSIQAVLDGVRNLTKELRDRKIKLFAGVVGYRDGSTPFKLNPTDTDQFGLILPARDLTESKNLDQFNSFVASIVAQGGGDVPEPGFPAIEKAIELLKSQPSSSDPDTVKALLFITDAPSYSTIPSNFFAQRFCDMKSVVTTINNYSASVGPGKFKFFYAVPETFSEELKCSDGAGQKWSPLDQMKALMTQIIPELSEKERGGPVTTDDGKMAWPLTANNLADELVEKLEKFYVKSSFEICLAVNAEISHEGKTIFHWEADDRKTLTELMKQENEWTLENIFSCEDSFPLSEDHEKATKGKKCNREAGSFTYEVKINRCCIDSKDVEQGIFDTCQSSYKQTGQFTIVNRP